MFQLMLHRLISGFGHDNCFGNAVLHAATVRVNKVLHKPEPAFQRRRASSTLAHPLARSFRQLRRHLSFRPRRRRTLRRRPNHRRYGTGRGGRHSPF